MIVHVMLIDKKLEATLWAIDLLKHVRGYASVLVLALRGCLSVEQHYRCRLSNVERFAQQGRLRSRWDRSLRKPERQLRLRLASKGAVFIRSLGNAPGNGPSQNAATKAMERAALGPRG